MVTAEDGRTHFVGDGCDGGHPEELTLADLDTIAYRTVRAAKSRIEEVELTRQRQHIEVDRLADELIDGDQRIVADFEAQVTQFMRRRLATLQKGDKRSCSGLYFHVETLAIPPDYVRDDAELMPWAEQHGYVKTKTTTSLDWERLKGERVKKGDAVPGVQVVERDPKITVHIS